MVEWQVGFGAETRPAAAKEGSCRHERAVTVASTLGVIIAFVALDGDRIFLAVLCVGQGSTSFPMLSLWSNRTVLRLPLARVRDIREYTASARRSSSTSAWTEPLAVSDELRQQKSTFQAYATRFRIQADGPSNTSSLMRNEVIPQLLAHIQETDVRTRRASHAMYAWRMRPVARDRPGIRDTTGTVVFGPSDVERQEQAS